MSRHGQSGQQSDARLVERARRGDDRAFDALVERHAGSARRIAASILGDWTEAEDMAQEAFVRAHRNLDLLADPAKFAPWLRRIVFGASIDWLRAFRPELYRGASPGELEAPDAGPLPSEPLLQRELERRVRDAIAELPDRYRLPLTLFHLEGLSHAKLAAHLGAPTGTIKSLLSRARARLRVLLEARPEAAEAMDVKLFDAASSRGPGWLHVHNGDAARAVLEASDIPGEHSVWAETLHEGPVRGREPRSVWRSERAAFYASLGPPPPGMPPAPELLARWDRGLERHADFREVILWFEHDLFDQLCLIHHLDFFAHRDLGATQLSLVCIGAHPALPHFLGLAQLSPDQMASLIETRQRVTPEQSALATRAWNALCADTPTELAAVAAEDHTALPFLAGALRRFLEEFPSRREGISRTERQVLAHLQGGPADGAALFRHNQGQEESPFMGDLLFWLVLRRLASGDRPLLQLDGDAATPMPERTATLSADGARVCRGEADAVALNGIDLWRGGVHLEGREGIWRWDPDARILLRG